MVDGSLSGCGIARARDRFGLAPEMHIMARRRAWVPGRSSHRTTKTIREGAWECRIQLTGTAKMTSLLPPFLSLKAYAQEKLAVRPSPKVYKAARALAMAIASCPVKR